MKEYSYTSTPPMGRTACTEPQCLYKGALYLLPFMYRVFPGGKERPGRDADPSPPFSAVGHERVELYLYFPYGPYGLYRASVPVKGCTLPFTFYLPGLSRGVKSSRGVTLTPHPLLMPLVKKE